MSFAVDIAAMVLAMPRALFPEAADDPLPRRRRGWLAVRGHRDRLGGGRARLRLDRPGPPAGSGPDRAVCGWGVAVALSGLGAVLWLTVALLAVAGAADLVSAVYRQTILQTYAPDEMRGRMQGVFIVVVAGGPRLGDLRAGATAAAFGATAAWVGGGLACVVVVLVLAVAQPALVRYRRPTESSAGPEGAGEGVGEAAARNRLDPGPEVA